jgi:hypothetical protein
MRATLTRLVLTVALGSFLSWPAAAEPKARSDPNFPSLNRLSPGMGRSTVQPPPQPSPNLVCDVYGRCWTQPNIYLVQPPPGYGYYVAPNGSYYYGSPY